MCHRNKITTTIIRSYSTTRLAEVGRFETRQPDENCYPAGQTFLHRIFGYRGVTLFPWLARIQDFDLRKQYSDTSGILNSNTKPNESPKYRYHRKSNNLEENKTTESSNEDSPATEELDGGETYIPKFTNPQATRFHPYYQVLIDTRDCPFVSNRTQTEAVTFLGHPDNSKSVYSIKGLDYVAHEDILPYTSHEEQPIHHELHKKLFKYNPQSSDGQPKFTPTDLLDGWRGKHPWLELSRVYKETTENVRVTVIPFYLGHTTIEDTSFHWWRYCVRLENFSDVAVQLRERHWKIFSQTNMLQTIKGRGVVGVEPLLTKNEPAYQYSSHVNLQDKSGHMWGTFKMQREDGYRPKIERFEEWLSSVESRNASSTNVGPDYDAVRRQIKDIDVLINELEQKQTFLESISDLTFDEIDPKSLHIRSQSTSIFQDRLEKINCRWRNVCSYVEDRRETLRKAELIWKLLQVEGPQLFDWLRQIECSLDEISEAARNVSDAQAENIFVTKLINRSEKLDAQIKRKQSLLTSLESRVRVEIDKFDDPCSMLVIELEKRLEDIQDNWNQIMRKKRMLDYNLHTLKEPPATSDLRGTIPLPEPITATSCNNISQQEPNQSFSDDEMSSTTNLTSSLQIFDDQRDETTSSFQHILDRSVVESNLDDGLSTPEKISRLESSDFCHNNHHHHNGETHHCRVEEWKHSLESFSSWLRQVESSLGLDGACDSTNERLKNGQSWSQLDLYGKLCVLRDIEERIESSCQGEFDCLIIQGQQIIEDLIPEIEGNEYEANLKEILSDIEIRYGAVKRCINDRKVEIADKEKWRRLSRKLRDSCDYLVQQMSEMIPETSIGLDLITLAQQQDRLMHLKDDLENNMMVHSSLQESESFLRLCDFLQHQCGQQERNSYAGATKKSDIDIWLAFKEFKEEIEDYLDRLKLHYSELSQLIEDRLTHLDEVHREMHALQQHIQELAAKLQVVEILKSNWVHLENLTIEQLSEQLEDLKLYRERLCEIESIHKMISTIFDWMEQSEVPLSQSNIKRLEELNSILSSIETAVDDRQKLIEQAFDEQSSSEQKFLSQTVADLPNWERRVATTKVPYFIDHSSNKTLWDHPKFTEMLNDMDNLKQYVFSVYRTAMKVRTVQKRLAIDMLMLEKLKEIFDSLDILAPKQTNGDNVESQSVQTTITLSDTTIGVEQIILVLKAIYEQIQSEESSTKLDAPMAIELTLNWLLNLYDSSRTGQISPLSLKVGLALLCCATREEKYIYMFELIANPTTGTVDARKLGSLFEICMRVPIYLNESESFGGTELIESTIRNCFSMSKFNPHHPNSIDLNDYLNWLKTEPQFIIWLPVLHRLLISENMTHNVKCKLCDTKPIVGLRYKCLKCFNFNVCQNCFLTASHIYNHFDPDKHPMREYCCKTSSGENVRDFTKILKNKLNPRRVKQ